MTIYTNVTVTAIKARMGTDPRNGQPAQHTEIFYQFERDGTPACALTRVPWAMADSAFARAAEREQFIRRNRSAP